MAKFTCSKNADVGEVGYSVHFDLGEAPKGRITLYRWHGTEYESVSWNGDIGDYRQFDDLTPEDWFDLAADIIREKVI